MGLSQRGSVLLGLCHIISILLVAVTSAAPSFDVVSRGWNAAAGLRRSRAAGGPNPVDEETDGQKDAAGEACRCAADQWEGVLRSIDREFYVTGPRTDSEQPAAAQRLGVAEMVFTVRIEVLGLAPVQFDVLQ